ncbi:isoleucine--tRNA ligase [archaeon 13_1_40CM_4_53_4]|nr:MAG: isoleucine--tRNA ligase [archaeon 13_2_20CM_2_53_6]OLC61966.1 MAG: isoleucine--tRNA ligase [archaeon 13_1_40CM_4_53_4]OLE58596.1 MAG: isoleucine--tRNA ligase [Crenarchaeota archaeon 13_1_20CM_2_53_14]
MVGKLTRDYKPSKSEEEILRWWKTSRAYEKTKKRFLKKPKFYFVDGPPFVTNPPHVGTGWNKTLKDVVIRFQRMNGHNVHDQPGYDCHGLPVEVMVEKSLNLTSKKDIENVIGIDRFIAECKKYSDENIESQTRVFKDLGIWMDWESPYVTYQDRYIESVWWTVKQAQRKKLLYKGLRVVHWCPHDETALAGYEVTDEYRMIKDHSIYVKLPIVDKPREFLLIWTTTPWTLPANEGVMVHPNMIYLSVEVDGEKLIIAKERLSQVMGERPYKILEERKGQDLEGVSYVPPLLEETHQKTGGTLHRVFLSSEYVTMTDGTGLVHMAPGHGEEDFEIGQRNGLPVLSPVDASGRFTPEAGKYAGLQVREANPVIVKDLEARGLLFREETIEHSYPHCWRCKTPLILRATDQWFIKVTDFKDKMLRENKSVRWTPEWAGSKRFYAWLVGARDWVISRQRYWGTPLPVWTCHECGERTVVGSRTELEKIAIRHPRKYELHRNGVDQIETRCRCGGRARREPDVLDGWLDSGVASWAGLNYPPNAKELRAWWPADAIVEAHDQTRGWFYNQLGSSILVFNKTPYKSVLMHGHTLDPDGEKMSKSKGNFVSPGDVIGKYGRDALRFYTLQTTVWEDFRFSWNAVEAVARDLQIIWNVYAFATLYMSLDKFAPLKWPLQRLSRLYRQEDKWLLSRTERLVQNVSEHNEEMEFHHSARALRDFVIEDLSHWYIRLVRRRFWLEKKSRDKLAAYAVLHHALRTWLSLAAPMMPFVTETIYRESFRGTEPKGPETVHMTPWPGPSRRWINKTLEEEVKIVQHISEAVASARQSKKVKLRQPVSRILVVSDKPMVTRTVKALHELLLQRTNAKHVRLVGITEAERLKRLIVEPNFKGLGPAFRGNANKVAQALRTKDGRELLRAFKADGHFPLKTDHEDYKITSEMVTLREEMPENYALGSFDEGRVYVDLTIPADLVREGFVRDVIRRLQEMRKRLDLPVDAFADTFISVADPERLGWLEDERDLLMEEVRAKTLLLLRLDQAKPGATLEETWQIEGHELHMGLSQVTGKPQMVQA